MIIDVIDLNFKDLQFNKRYDMSRYNRGRGIYNNRYVEVTKVEKIDDENYDVEASVNGYYDTYTTTLKINRSLYLEKLIVSNKEINIAKNEQFTELINNIGNSEISEDIKIDEEFESKLRDYQKVGYKWLKTLEKYKFGGILADDMGLGKTLQIIAILRTEIQSKNKTTSIVVCPSTLVLNWKAEVEKWCGSIKTLVVRGNAEERKEKLSKDVLSIEETFINKMSKEEILDLFE